MTDERGDKSLPEKLRDRDAIVLGGLLYAGPVMLAAADRIDQLERELAEANAEIRSRIRENVDRMVEELGEPRSASVPISEAVRLRDRVERLRGLCKSAVGMLRDADSVKDATIIERLIGDMEPPVVAQSAIEPRDGMAASIAAMIEDPGRGRPAKVCSCAEGPLIVKGGCCARCGGLRPSVDRRRNDD